MSNVLWEGDGKKEHDSECDAKWAARYREIGKDICLATKGNKVWIRIMWAIVLLMLSLTLGGNIYGLSVASDQKAVDTQQTADIKHNTEQLRVVIDAHEKLVQTQAQMHSAIHTISVRQERVLTILERIEARVVD